MRQDLASIRSSPEPANAEPPREKSQLRRHWPVLISFSSPVLLGTARPAGYSEVTKRKGLIPRISLNPDLPRLRLRIFEYPSYRGIERPKAGRSRPPPVGIKQKVAKPHLLEMCQRLDGKFWVAASAGVGKRKRQVAAAA
jgi:hypothetical protein